MSWRENMTVYLEQCPCCGAALNKWSVVEGYQVERCARCDSAYVNPRPTVEALKGHYIRGGHGENTASSIAEVLEQERKYPNSTIDARRILAEIDNFAPGKRFLDVGCGYGFYCREALQLGFQIDAIEISPFERRCTQELTGIEPLPTSFEEFEAPESCYDAILMSQILEHVVDVREWVGKAARLLTPGGVLAVALPNFNSFVRRLLGTGDPMIHPPDHLNYFGEEALTLLLEREDLTVRLSMTLSRIPGTAVTERIPMPRRLELPIQRLVQACQAPLLSPLDRLRYGMFLNIYAVKSGVA